MSEEATQQEELAGATGPEGEAETSRRLFEAAQARSRNAQVFERLVVPNPEIRFGKFAELCPDLNVDAGEGQPEPEAISFKAGNRSFVFPLSEQNKAGLLQRLAGGVMLATAADLAKVTKTP